jgi:hypothetical protein
MKRFKKYTSEDKSLERALASDAQKPKKPVTLKKAPWEKNEANDAYCSDECCGSDVKAEDCPCPADCDHCSCNAVNEGLEEGKMKDFHDMVNKGMSAAQIAKKIKMPVKDVADFMKDMKKEDLDETKKVSDMTPEEKAANDKRRKEYNEYQKSKRNESVDQLDEISPELQKSYSDKARKQYKQSANKRMAGGGDYGSATKAAQDKHQKRFDKRHKGIGSVIKRSSDQDLPYKDPKGLVRKDPKSNTMTGKKAPYKNKNESVEEVSVVLNDYLTNLEEGGLWANIHAKRKRIKNGSKEKMKKPGSKGAPTDQDFKDASESVEEAFSDWKIQHPTKSTKSYTVKARNTGEALKKGHAAAIKAGDMHKASDPRTIQNKHVSKNESTVDEGSCGSVNASKKKVSGSDKKKLLNVAGLKKNANDKNLQANYESFKESLDEAAIDDITALYINENNITLDQLEDMTEEEINEIIGKAIGGAFKLGAKAVVGTARLAGKAVGGTAKAAKAGANRVSASGRADAAEKKADAAEKKAADRERITAAKQRVTDLKKKQRDAKNGTDAKANGTA